jgi:exopolysaccharide biosynthesis protein
VDTEGGPGFATGRHPRTAVGVARGGRRLLLVVVDGRQKGYSDGMTLRELAEVMRAFGARDAINLDGGGSTTLVYADPDSSGKLRVANRPSDPTGERPVGNALAIVRGCR